MGKAGFRVRGPGSRVQSVGCRVQEASSLQTLSCAAAMCVRACVQGCANLPTTPSTTGCLSLLTAASSRSSHEWFHAPHDTTPRHTLQLHAALIRQQQQPARPTAVGGVVPFQTPTPLCLSGVVPLLCCASLVLCLSRRLPSCLYLSLFVVFLVGFAAVWGLACLVGFAAVWGLACLVGFAAV